MKIQPEASNAISIELDDGSIIRLHHTLHGGTDYLFIHGDNVTIEKFEGLKWIPITTTQRMIRIFSKPTPNQ